MISSLGTQYISGEVVELAGYSFIVKLPRAIEGEEGNKKTIRVPQNMKHMMNNIKIGVQVVVENTLSGPRTIAILECAPSMP